MLGPIIFFRISRADLRDKFYGNNTVAIRLLEAKDCRYQPKDSGLKKGVDMETSVMYPII